MPEIHPVTIYNWRALIDLQVRDDQKNFVASNMYSIAEAQFGFDMEGHWELYPFGIFDDSDQPVGFLMYGYNFQNPARQAFIFRLMVDVKFQGMGYGRFGMQKMIETFRANESINEIGISYEPENEAAKKLYASLGFVATGEMLGNESLAVLKIRS